MMGNNSGSPLAGITSSKRSTTGVGEIEKANIPTTIVPRFFPSQRDTIGDTTKPITADITTEIEMMPCCSVEKPQKKVFR